MFEILDAQGTVTNTIVADLAFVEAHHPGRYRAVEPTSPATSLEALPRTLTHIQFRKRLTGTEQIIFDNFDAPEYAAAEPKITGLTVMQRAAVRSGLATYKEADEVNLDDPDTVALVTLFGALGLWDHPGRAAEILA